MTGIHHLGACLLTASISIIVSANSGYTEELTAEQLYERGYKANNESHFADAVVDFTAAIKKNPEYWKAYANRACARYQTHDYKGAKSDLETATPHLPKLQTLIDLKASVDRALDNEAHPNQTQVVRTQYVPVYRPYAVATTPADQIMQMASMLRAHGYKIPSNLVKPMPNDLIHPMTGHLINPNGGSAAESKPQEVASAVNPQPSHQAPASSGEGVKMSAQDYFERGSEKSKANDLPGAIKDFDECIKLDPKHGPAYANRGSVKANLGDTNGALDDFDKACALMPDNPGVKELHDKIKQAIDQVRAAQAH